MLPPSNANCLNMLPYQYTLTANAVRMSAQSATTELQIHGNIAQHCHTALALTKRKAFREPTICRLPRARFLVRSYLATTYEFRVSYSAQAQQRIRISLNSFQKKQTRHQVVEYGTLRVPLWHHFSVECVEVEQFGAAAREARIHKHCCRGLATRLVLEHAQDVVNPFHTVLWPLSPVRVDTPSAKDLTTVGSNYIHTFQM